MSINTSRTSTNAVFELYQKYGVILTGKDRAVRELVVQYDWAVPVGNRLDNP